MNKQIETEWYINSDCDMVWFRYFVDNDGIWYSYNDLCETLHLSGRKAEGMYKDLASGNKRIYYVMKNKYSGLDERFINIVGLQEIEQRNNERFKTVYRNIQSLNIELGIYVQMSEKEVLKEFICHAIDNDALEEFIIDEEKIDCILDYEYYNNKQPVLKKIEKPENYEDNIMKYNKDREGKTSCPSWIKDIVK